MATLIQTRKARRARHLRLVTDADTETTPLALADPNPGPRDAAAVVRGYAHLLPETAECEGMFSLGSG